MTADFCLKPLMEQIADFIVAKTPEFSIEEHSDTSFSSLGLDSADHVRLSALVEDHLSIEVDPTLAFDYPTINALTAHLEQHFADTARERN
ncbi:acyl carrier protein [Microbulbifer taiwanensis]|uniref:Acyl carrier protein n=1 Tax=Microbulbifer taiwanensis TaxID=986746 RepID=A0ABW1YWE9_9GAMM|nr:acyl carrier protein [Microbulbifer taiwanensis]